MKWRKNWKYNEQKKELNITKKSRLLVIEMILTRACGVCILTNLNNTNILSVTNLTTEYILRYKYKDITQ